MDLYVGTSGFAYKEWKGYFYPEKLPAKEMLHYYGEKLNAVEINNTFYRMPRTSVLENWAEQVPESFRFSIKATRRITHFKRLKEESESELGYLLDAVAVLGKRLGVILFQLPPNFRADVERLRGFLQLLPDGTRAAFEFRNASWFSDEVYEALADRNCALCIADAESGFQSGVTKTADWGYLRLRKPGYDDDELRRWAEDIGSQEWKESFVFFKHEDEGSGPRMAAQFSQLFDTD